MLDLLVFVLLFGNYDCLCVTLWDLILMFNV